MNLKKLFLNILVIAVILLFTAFPVLQICPTLKNWAHIQILSQNVESINSVAFLNTNTDTNLIG